jgi:hypothetical protein
MKKPKRNKRQWLRAKCNERNISGDLIYWQYNAAIKSSVGKYIDTLNTVGRNQKDAISHYVVSPLVEQQFRVGCVNGGMFYPSGDRSLDTIFSNVHLTVQDPYDKNTYHPVKAWIAIVPECLDASLVDFNSPVKMASDLSMKKEYLTETETDRLRSEGYDILVLLFAPSDSKLDYFPYIRWVGERYQIPFIHHNILDEKLLSYKSRLPHGGYEVMRLGGSNGDVCVNRNLFRFMHLADTGPRQSHGSLWIPSRNSRKWHMLYINCFASKKRKVTSFSYAQPVEGGQFLLTRKDVCFPPKDAYSKMLFLFAQTKALSPNICLALSMFFNKSTGDDRNVASHATIMQSYTNNTLRGISDSDNSFYANTLFSSNFTLLLHPVSNHIDVCSPLSINHPLKGVTTSFFENKVLFVSPKMSTFDLNGPALGRGGAGRGKFVFGLVDHGSNQSNVASNNDHS